MKPQVDKSIYYGKNYLAPGRFAVYGHQLRELITLEPDTLLEIGVGNALVSRILRETGLAVTTIDHDPALSPDVVGSVTSLPFKTASFDVVACFEVLEHIPYEQIPQALGEIHRVCRRHAVISLPDASLTFRVHIPGLLRKKVYVQPFRRPRPHAFNGEHYWEINKKGFPLKDVRARMEEAGFIVEHTFRPWEMAHHRFFRLKKTGAP